MDIQTINNAIDELEHSDTTYENISDLAHLYIVRTAFHTENEADDILPAYNKYVALKRQYQLGEITEMIVIKSLQTVCTEIQELVSTLYKCTDMNKERKCIREMIQSMHDNFKTGE